MVTIDRGRDSKTLSLSINAVEEVFIVQARQKFTIAVFQVVNDATFKSHKVR